MKIILCINELKHGITIGDIDHSSPQTFDLVIDFFITCWGGAPVSILNHAEKLLIDTFYPLVNGSRPIFLRHNTYTAVP